MRLPRKCARPVRLSWCLLAAAVVAACGGGGDPGESPLVLEASSDGRASIASAFANSADLAAAAAVIEYPAAIQELADPTTAITTAEMASGAPVENNLTDAVADLSTMPSPSAGPLSMANASALASSSLAVNLLISTSSIRDLKAVDFNRPPISAPRLVGTGSASLTWKLPTTRADGLAVGALSGYRIYYGNASGVYASNVFIAGGSRTAGYVSGLGRGIWYFAVTTVDASGNESGFGYEMSKSL